MVRQLSSPVASRSLSSGLSGSWLTLTAIQRYLNRSKDKKCYKQYTFEEPIVFQLARYQTQN